MSISRVSKKHLYFSQPTNGEENKGVVVFLQFGLMFLVHVAQPPLGSLLIEDHLIRLFEYDPCTGREYLLQLVYDVAG